VREKGIMSRLGSLVVCCVAVLTVAVVGCSSNTSASKTPATSAAPATAGPTTSYPAGKEQICQARDQLKTSVAALTNPTLLVGGASAIKAAVDKVQTDLSAVKSSASQDYQPQVDAMQTAVQQLQTAAGNLGNGNVSDNLKAVGTAIAKVGTTSSDLFTKLRTACGS
jgi:hypothetical protein